MVLFLLILCVVGVISAIAIISSLRAYTFDITQRNNAEAVMASMLRGIEKFYDSRGSVSVNVNYQTSIPGWRSTTHDGANVATISISQPWNKETLKAAVKVVSLSAEIVDITWDAGDCYVLVARQNNFNSGFYSEIKPWVDRLGRDRKSVV
jgi:Tfp pilus assembly protein PilE